MRARGFLRYWLYGSIGSFPYFGVRVHFPRRCLAFRAVCEQGIFEADNVRLLQNLCRPRSHVLDVGANLGLMAIPILASVSDVRVISYEPSPNSLPWLKQTIVECGFGSRWEVVEKALGVETGITKFSISHVRHGLFDGLKHTGRAPEKDQIDVELTTLDAEWQRMDNPPVSVIKIDVEGGEFAVLRGAIECIKHTRPFVMFEWNRQNVTSYGTKPDELLEFAQALQYSLHAVPSLVPIRNCIEFELHQTRTESFLLVPDK